ncbi:YkgJ family cysteine cluster protein [Halobaculum roseum]|uniref:YkgJ family cysteine cluster protein n=1 Tax=Halobaculum roseum TaxID=2175149 RepID=A0ABD5MG14_9EURY|nr:YkgJ family cysteine cluster protein [Halobaculum roseum]QZY02422.1 YkgJ family cysteine cluster protein [Halobaculum roseum]
MQSLEAELERARALDVSELADAVETIGFECTRCGACCKSEAEDPHTATVFPDEVRRLQEAAAAGTADEDDGGDRTDGDGDEGGDARDWRDVARPMPYGLVDGDDGPDGETFEWALQTDSCGDCVFYEEDEDGVGACGVHADRPLICETYPFSVDLEGTSQPMGEAVDSVALGSDDEADETDDTGGAVRAHECEGLGRDIDREDAESLAAALKERAVRELEEAIAVRDNYDPVSTESGEVVVHDSEGAKHPDGSRRDG